MYIYIQYVYILAQHIQRDTQNPAKIVKKQLSYLPWEPGSQLPHRRGTPHLAWHSDPCYVILIHKMTVVHQEKNQLGWFATIQVQIFRCLKKQTMGIGKFNGPAHV